MVAVDLQKGRKGFPQCSGLWWGQVGREVVPSQPEARIFKGVTAVCWPSPCAAGPNVVCPGL